MIIKKQLIKYFLWLFPYFLWGQFTKKKYDIINLESSIEINPHDKMVKGIAIYKIKSKSNTKEIIFDAPDIKILKVKTGCLKSNFYQTKQHLKIQKKFKKNKIYKIFIKYTAYPKKAMYFTGWESNGVKQIWTQGQGKNNSHWLPTNDDQNDKFTWTFHIKFNSSYHVISNGMLKNIKKLNDNTNIFTYVQNKEAPAYLIFIGIGKYQENIIYSSSHTPIFNYQYFEKIKNDKTYYKTREIFNFLEQEIGIKYPWENYKQVPCRDFLYGGMENVSATSFNGDLYIVDSLAFNDNNFVNVSAHELTHQWFGDLVTGQSATDHWLHEGFATYYARLNDAFIFGNDYNDYNIYKYDQQIITSTKLDTIPILSPNASSLTYYQKGAKLIAMMRKKIGNDNYQKVIKKFLKKFAYKNASTHDFKRILYDVTHDSLTDFFKLWFESNKIPIFKLQQKNDSIIFIENSLNLPIDFQIITHQKTYQIKEKENFQLKNFNQIKTIIVNPKNELLADIYFDRNKKLIRNQILYANNFIDKYIAIKKIRDWPLKEKIDIFEKLIIQNNYYPIYKEIIYQIKNKLRNDKALKLLIKLFNKDLKTRQQIATQIDNIPFDIKNKYKSLLQDSSYITKQSCLWHYWANFKSERKSILKETANITDNYDKTFRISWLSMAILTPNFQPNNKILFIQELIDYSSNNYNISIRLNAFKILINLGLINSHVINNLFDAGLHFNWHMHKYALEILKNLFQNKNYKQLILKQLNLLPKEQRTFYKKYLNKKL